MRASCAVCGALKGEPHDVARHAAWGPLAEGGPRDRALAVLRRAIETDEVWPSNRSLREACYEAIAILGEGER